MPISAMFQYGLPKWSIGDNPTIPKGMFFLINGISTRGFLSFFHFIFDFVLVTIIFYYYLCIIVVNRYRTTCKDKFNFYSIIISDYIFESFISIICKILAVTSIFSFATTVCFFITVKHNCASLLYIYSDQE